MVIVDADNTRLTPAYHPVGTLVRYAVGTDVETVLVAGRVVVDDGSVLAIDEPSLLDEAEQLGDKLGRCSARAATTCCRWSRRGRLAPWLSQR